MFLQRLSRCLPAAWAGELLAGALIAAPALFATLERPMAGLAAGRIFAVDAQLSLGLGAALLILERRSSEQRAQAGQGSRFTLNLVLILVALFCVVLGYYALQPLMLEARAGRGPYSFGMLHGVSTLFYAVKTGAVLALAWRAAA